ncbi:ELO family, partial [Dimargaris cristalligena]
PVESLPWPSLFPWAMHWKTPVLTAIVYAATVKYINTQQPTGGLSRVQARYRKAAEGASMAFTTFVVLHNLLLCVYSAVTFYHAVTTLHQRVQNEYSWHGVLCDTEEKFWRSGLYYWGYLFYLSKYYEIIDTIIILLKGRRSSTLQTYHHSGAILCMWAGIQFRSIPIWIFVVFNSLVHTIMYFYYLCTTVGLHPPGKPYITFMQITQFLLGIFMAVGYLFVPNCLVTEGSRFAAHVNVLYLLPLIYLFVQFAINTYSR